MIIENLYSNFAFIIVDLVLGSIMAFTGIITYGKTKKISVMFFVLSSLFLYLDMVFRLLERINVFMIESVAFGDIPLIKYLIIDLPYVCMIIGFILILFEKDRK